MDTRWGKYDGPLAALAESWVLNGDFGDEEWSNSDIGEGTILWKAPIALTYSDAMYLKSEHDVTDAELADLDKQMSMAQGISYGWDSQGFQYGSTFETVGDYVEGVVRIQDLNSAEDDEDGEATR